MMTQIKESLTILKARWLEVAVIIGLATCRVVLHLVRLGVPEQRPFISNILLSAYGIIALSLYVMALLLRFGFLRTAYLQGQQRASLWKLLRTGVHFLWRMIVLGALYRLPLVAFVLFSLNFLARRFSPEDTRQFSFWAPQLFYLTFNVVLVKLIVLLPALVIVLDCGPLESFKFLKRCRILQAKELILLFYAQVALSFLPALVPHQYDLPRPGQVVLHVSYVFVVSVLGLIISLTAVRFVGSLDFVYDGSQGPSSIGMASEGNLDNE
jgi:hypothetical protein